MSKFLNIPNGNYKISVQPGGEITLNTGVNNGTTRITGDLIVEGNTTTVNTQNLDIEDNIIVLNKGEFGPGVTEGSAGIQIDRGPSASDALMLLDETEQYKLVSNGEPYTTLDGTIVFKYADGTFIPLLTNQIATRGASLYLINEGSGTVSVVGTEEYESNVIHDDDLPNKKYVDDYVETFFSTNFQNRIDDGVVSTSFIEVKDFERTGVESKIDVGVEGQLVASFQQNTIELNEIRISGTQIESTNTGSDLRLGSPGVGSVRIDDSLIISTPIDDAVIDPAIPDEGVKLYIKARAEGGTGLFFVNSDTTRDEVVSKNRSLLFSMLF